MVEALGADSEKGAQEENFSLLATHPFSLIAGTVPPFPSLFKNESLFSCWQNHYLVSRGFTSKVRYSPSPYQPWAFNFLYLDGVHVLCLHREQWDVLIFLEGFINLLKVDHVLRPNQHQAETFIGGTSSSTTSVDIDL